MVCGKPNQEAGHLFGNPVLGEARRDQKIKESGSVCAVLLPHCPAGLAFRLYYQILTCLFLETTLFFNVCLFIYLF